MKRTLSFCLALTLALSCSSEPEFTGDHGGGTGGVGASGGSGTGGSTLNLGGAFNLGGNGSTGGTSSCVDVTVDFEPEIPTVILLIDQSGSMNQDLGGVNRWNAVRDSLIGTDGVVTTLEDRVQFGLMLYTGPTGTGPGNSTPSGSACPVTTEVSPALNNLSTIQGQYDPNDWLWETPTGESLALAVETLEGYPEPRVIVLATDGEPDTCAQPNPQSGQQVTLDAVSAAFAEDITTYVLSVGNDVSDTHLRQVANVGQGYPIDDPSNRFYRSNSQAELSAAFDEIINGERSCVLALNGNVVPGSEDSGSVTLDGADLEYDTDWVLNTPSEMELVGNACDTVLSGEHDLDITFPCGTIIIVR